MTGMVRHEKQAPPCCSFPQAPMGQAGCEIQVVGMVKVALVHPQHESSREKGK